MHRNTRVRTILATLAVYSACQAAKAPASAPPSPRPSVEGNEARAAEPNGVITLRDALALALACNPQLSIFPYDLRAADGRILQAGLRPNPQLDIAVEEFGGRGERSGFDAAETTVQVGQPIGERFEITQRFTQYQPISIRVNKPFS